MHRGRKTSSTIKHTHTHSLKLSEIDMFWGILHKRLHADFNSDELVEVWTHVRNTWRRYSREREGEFECGDTLVFVFLVSCAITNFCCIILQKNTGLSFAKQIGERANSGNKMVKISSFLPSLSLSIHPRHTIHTAQPLEFNYLLYSLHIMAMVGDFKPHKTQFKNRTRLRSYAHKLTHKLIHIHTQLLQSRSDRNVWEKNISYRRRNKIPRLVKTLNGRRDEGGRDLKDGDVVVQFEANLADVQHALDDGTPLFYVLLCQNLFRHPQSHLMGSDRHK